MEINNDGPLSGSFHNQRISPQHTAASGGGIFNYPDVGRPSSPGSSGEHLKTSSLEWSSDGIPKKELTKTLALDRTNDAVYAATTNVVKAIMALSQGVEKAVASEYLELVRNVGIELRALLASVDALAAVFPAQAHK